MGESLSDLGEGPFRAVSLGADLIIEGDELGHRDLIH